MIRRLCTAAFLLVFAVASPIERVGVVSEPFVKAAQATQCLSRENALLQTSRVSSDLASSTQPARNSSCSACFDVFEAADGCAAWQMENAGALQSLMRLPDLAGCRDRDCTKEVMTGCSDGPAAAAAPMQCTDSCMYSFVAAGLCAALKEKSHTRIMNIMSAPTLAFCSVKACEGEIFEECFPKEEAFCDSCVSEFEKAGGCEVPEELVGDYVPTDCWPCGEEALVHCMQVKLPVPEGCGACLQALGTPAKCAARLHDEDSEQLPHQCYDSGRACWEAAAAHCGQWSSEGCYTVQQDHTCFQHIRWAMQIGVVVHPDWYAGLTQSSNFEDFQALLHERGAHECPAPCSPLPQTWCHTAMPGEQCHGHTTWAMESGVTVLAGSYPSSLKSGTASFEDFQDWLHHIHHGNCPAPCRTV